ncbi:Uncharacterised protein [Mycobacterium tuberculosis]|nr:Uncharacterised protein [Mycobacterium tuberculosis]
MQGKVTIFQSRFLKETTKGVEVSAGQYTCVRFQGTVLILKVSCLCLTLSEPLPKGLSACAEAYRE